MSSIDELRRKGTRVPYWGQFDEVLKLSNEMTGSELIEMLLWLADIGGAPGCGLPNYSGCRKDTLLRAKNLRSLVKLLKGKYVESANTDT